VGENWFRFAGLWRSTPDGAHDAFSNAVAISPPMVGRDPAKCDVVASLLAL